MPSPRAGCHGHLARECRSLRPLSDQRSERFSMLRLPRTRVTADARFGSCYLFPTLRFCLSPARPSEMPAQELSIVQRLSDEGFAVIESVFDAAECHQTITDLEAALVACEDEKTVLRRANGAIFGA